MPVDLHTHSSISDGSETPSTVVALAAEAGLGAIALTDHDSLAGVSEARAVGMELGVEVVSGVELSVDWGDRQVHVLAYFVEPEEPGPLQQRLGFLRRGRAERNAAIIRALSEQGISITAEDVAAEAVGAESVGRPHIAAALVRLGEVSTVAEAFARYLARGRPAYRPRPRLDLEEAAALTWSEGGVPVVAHPHTVGVSAAEYDAAFRGLVDAGIGGFECFYAEYTPEVRQRLAELATSLGVVATGGSDFHGSYKPEIEVGVGRGDLLVPDRCLEDLELARRT